MEKTRRARPSKIVEQSSYKLKETEAAHVGPMQVCTKSSTYVPQLSVEYYYGTHACVNKWILILVLFSWAFSQFCWLALSNFNMMTFVLSYYVILLCFLLSPRCLFFSKEKKERRTSRCERWRKTEGTEEKEAVFRLYFRRKEYLFFKRAVD